MNHSDVIVVGAGLAGLAAARKLVAAGKTVRVLEARDRIGGRLKNGSLSDGQWVEVGGQWLGPGQDRMYELVREFDLETIPTWNEGDTLIGLGGKLTRMGARKGAIPRLSPFVLADLAQGLARWNKVAASVDLARPWETPRARVLDGQTWHSWIQRNLRTAAGRAYFHVACEAILSADATDMSALHAAFYSASGVDLETLMAVDRGAQQDRVAGGTVLIAERLADELAERVELNAVVRSIRYGLDPEPAEAPAVTVVCRDGREFTADAVVVAIPPTLAGRIDYDPPLPPWRDQLTQRLPMGSVIKMYAVYERPFWRDAGLNGQVGSETGPVKVTFDNTPPGYDRGIMLGFMEATDGREWGRRSVEERQSAFVSCLVNYFGEQAAHPVEFIELDWAAEEFSRGCYGAHFTTGTWTSFGQALRDPVGPVHWAGTEYSPVWNGYMEGAVLSGEHTAAEVLGSPDQGAGSGGA